MSPDDAPLLVRREDDLLVLTLNRPDRLNAVSLPLYRALVEALREAGEDAGVRAVVLAGAGRAFSVGADLKAHASEPLAEAARREYVRLAQEANELLQSLPRPVVAAVNGHAIGGGLEMALSSDFIVVAEAAKLRFPEVTLGTFLGGGVTRTLSARVGLAKARELLYLGEFFSGAEAAVMGLADRALSTERVLPEALELAGRLARKAPRSLAHAKRLLGLAPGLDRRRLLDLEAEALLDIMGTRDWQEGLDAFHEGREPEYTGE
ncbi:MAG: enoyl-CoA hydratase/isomerase family protein [Candidatus Palauibacterales bacterium]|nr:enoyl-CoA hydratase/isomerase family protein [Candidatus Palauibacterales bacterium]MDP2584714.1 enoyl-CoA hydratase/isomerase family protein [Candidatus Palauibacterales bacterium]